MLIFAWHMILVQKVLQLFGVMCGANVIGTKRPASRDLSRGAVRQTHHEREIERLTATNHIRQRVHQQKGKASWGNARGMESEQIFSLRCHTEQANKLDACRKSCLRMTFHPLNTLQKETWWSRTGSNRRHPACKAGALPAELRPLIPVWRNGGPGRT